MTLRRVFIRLFTVLASIVLALYGLDRALDFAAVGKRHAHLAPVSAETCATRDELVAQHGLDRVLGDGGFRNYAYTKGAPEFIQAWADTMCLDKHSYRDGEKLIRVSMFPNQTYALNKYGRRGRDWDEARGSKDIRVFMVGGSTAFSLLSNEESAIHTVLERTLNRNSEGARYRVFNAALPGATATDEWNILHHEVADFSPSIVVFLTGINNGGRDEGECALLQDEDRQLMSTFHGAMGRLALRNLRHLIQFPATARLQARDAFTRYEVRSNAYCRERGIRCIFALQPTLLVERHLQSEAEQAIRHLVFSSKQGIRPENYEPDYDLFDKTFRSPENAFEYLDLRGLGSMGLFSGWVQPGQAQVFDTNTQRRAAKILYRSGKPERFSLRLDNRDLVADRCNAASLDVSGTNDYELRCPVQGYEALKGLRSHMMVGALRTPRPCRAAT